MGRPGGVFGWHPWQKLGMLPVVLVSCWGNITYRRCSRVWRLALPVRCLIALLCVPLL